MISKIFSSLPTFKTLSFKPGLNVLIAKRADGSSDVHTRNRAGKTSLVKIIHLLTGGSCEKGSIFKSSALTKFNFGMDFSLNGNRAIVSRSCENPSKLSVLEGTDTKEWPVQPSINKKTGEYFITNGAWRGILGKLAFDMTLAEDGRSIEEHGPTFRLLFPYFARRQEDGGFFEPTKQRSGQFAWEDQVALSYLLNLDWEIAREYQLVRDKEKQLETLRVTARTGLLSSIVGKSADLRTALTVLENKCAKTRDSLKNFKLLPKYKEYEIEGASLTRMLGKLADENTLDYQLIQEMEKSSQKEVQANDDSLKELYKEAGIVLPTNIQKRFEEVFEFHKSVIANRFTHLQTEIERAQKRIAKREQEMAKQDVRRSEIMALLQSHGALEQFNKCQTELTRCEADLEVTRKQFESALLLEEKEDELKDERSKLKKMIRQDVEARAETIKKAILYFEEVSRALYPEAGSLIFNNGNNGLEIDVKISGKSSKGITNMRIFCFDMMLMRILRERNLGLDFLVHDSHLFDGVDERQIAKAIEYGAAASKQFGFQYILTMNEDTIPNTLFSENFKFSEYVLPVTLTDSTDAGGLFGLRFES